MANYKIEQENELIKKKEMEFFALSIKPLRLGTPAHIHDIIEILFIEEGRFEVTCDNKTVCAEAGDIVLFRANSIHKTVAIGSDQNKYWVLKVTPRLLLKFLPKDNASDIIIWLSTNYNNNKFHWKKDEIANSDITDGISKLISESENTDGNADLAMRLAAVTVVLGILRKREQEGNPTLENTTITKLIYKAIAYVNSNYASPITAEQISKELNISYSYFSRSFKRLIGITFSQHLTAVRINNGESLLRNTDYSVSKISDLCGFESVSHFIATYKKIKGYSPLKSRKIQ